MPANDNVTAGMSDFDAFTVRSQAGAGGGPAADQYRSLVREHLSAVPGSQASTELGGQIVGMEEMAGARGGYGSYGGTPAAGQGPMDSLTVRRVYGETMWRRMFPHLAAAEDAANRQNQQNQPQQAGG